MRLRRLILTSSKGLLDPPYVVELPENSVVQCGQRVALIGIDIMQAGQSFDTGSAAGDLFKLFIAFTTRKIQKATIRKLMIKVTKFP